MSDEKIIIGIVPQYRTDGEKTFTRPWYPRMISRAGALPLMPAADEGCDGEDADGDRPAGASGIGGHAVSFC